MKTILAAFTMSVLMILPAYAQGRICLPRAEMIKVLQDKYGENVVMRGLSGPDKIMEVYQTPDGSTWSFVVTSTDGVSCLAGAGRYMDRVSAKPGEGV